MADSPTSADNPNSRLDHVAAALTQLSAVELDKVKNQLMSRQYRNINDQESPLLRLPRELRDIIHEFVLADEAPNGRWKASIKTGRRSYCRGCWSDNDFCTPSPRMFAVCQQLREEFAPLFWKTVIVHGRGGGNTQEDFVERFNRVDPTHKKHVRRIVCDADFESYCFRDKAVAYAAELDKRIGVAAGVVSVMHDIGDENVETSINALGVTGISDI